jgi:hypothetical protein
MGDVAAVLTLLGLVGVTGRLWWEQHAEDRADREAMRAFDEMREALR